jgi:tight adherence protein B
MSIVLLFVFILFLVFGLVMFLTRPTRKERLVESRLHSAAGRTALHSIETVDILKRDVYSDVPWLNSLFLRMKPAARLRRLIADADKDWSVGRLVAGTLLAAVVTYWFTRIVISNPLTPPFLTLAVFFGPYLFLLWKRHMRLKKFTQLLPEAMDLIARALRAGHSLTASMELVAQEIPDPVGTEFRRLFEEQNLGLPQRDALLNLAERIPLPDVHFLVASILIQKETGGNLVEVLEKTSNLLRDRIKLRGQLRVYTAQGRLTGWILCILPVVMFFLLTWLDPAYMSTLTTDPIGKKLLITGACLMLLGVLVIRKIVNIKV